jgi:alpha-L-fucosidase
VDAARLAGMRAALDRLFAADATSGRRARWWAGGAAGTPRAIGTIDLGRDATVAIADLGEDITRGQLVARYTVEGRQGTDGEWRPLSRGTTIGYRKLDRFAPTTIRQAQVIVEEALDTPRPVQLRLYSASSGVR